MDKSKYILVHHDQIVMHADTIVEIAKGYFGVQAVPRVDGNWAIEVNGRIAPRGYTSTRNDPELGFTKEEAELDYIRDTYSPGAFNKNRLLAYAIYELGGSR